MNLFAKMVELFRRGTAYREPERFGPKRSSTGINTDGTPMIGRIDMRGRFYGAGRKRLF
jgi:hypothetical protein